MQAVYTASLSDDAAAPSSAAVGESAALPLVEMALSVSPQSLAHAPLFFDKAARSVTRPNKDNASLWQLLRGREHGLIEWPS